MSNFNKFLSLEVVDRVSETQFQVGENSDWIIWQLKGKPSKRNTMSVAQGTTINVQIYLLCPNYLCTDCIFFKNIPLVILRPQFFVNLIMWPDLENESQVADLNIADINIYRHLGYERVHLPLYKVADTPFHIQGDDVSTQNDLMVYHTAL